MKDLKSIIQRFVGLWNDNKYEFLKVQWLVAKIDIGICYINNISNALSISYYLFKIGLRNVIWA